MRYANNGPRWAWCAAEDAGATPVTEPDLPPEGTYQIIGGVLFDIEGKPTFQACWVETP